jgi:uncharacterized integral membrane protein (TIGR00698 family)
MGFIERQALSGLLFSAAIGLSLFFLSPYLGGLNSVMMGLLVGILAGNFIKLPDSYSSGISFTSSKLLEISILFLAFSISISHIAGLGWQNFAIVVLVIGGVLALTVFLANKFNCPDSTGWLVGFGTAICGSAAIAAVAPGISKSKEAPGISLAVVNLMGSVGMIVLPLLLVFFNVSEETSGVLLGATLHSVGNVAGAAYGMDSSIGDTAITIKLARVALLSPAVIIFTFLVNTDSSKNWKQYLILPYYLWAFIAITVLTSLVDLPKDFLSWMSTLGKITLTIAMVAIGLKVSFRKLYQSGKRAVGFGLVIFALQVLIAGILIMVL